MPTFVRTDKSELGYARQNDPRYDPEVMGDEVMTTDSADDSQPAEGSQPA